MYKKIFFLKGERGFTGIERYVDASIQGMGAIVERAKKTNQISQKQNW